MSVIYSFFQLISKCRIEIPIIQRDYAQGRVNSKAKDVRKVIVSDLIKAVKGEKALFFDFVYGRLDSYKFIPFDGQQRLTTLFLFHKYVFERCQRNSNCRHKDSCICNEILKNFTYATRQSSREFCREMVEKKIIPTKENEKVSTHIINQSWFYSDWEKDPTIMGMLVMLDEIHSQFKDTNIEDYISFAEKLTSGCNCPITFYFVDMGGNRLPDETYVKMNARGKTLTPFENFKASLEQYLHEANEKELVNRLNSNIDGKWLDLFWNVINEGKNEKELPDSAMMSFFNRHFMNVWRYWYAQNSKAEAEDEIEEYETFNKRIIHEMPLYPSKDDFVSWDIYQYIFDKCDVNECLNPLFNIWDNLCEENSIRKDCQAVWNRKDDEIRWNLFEGERRKSDNRETYPSRVAFYALLKYFGEAKYSSLTLSQWMRVVWNIIENSTIDSSEPYHAALRLINKLSTNCSTIYDALANHFEDFGFGTQYHAKEQVMEECTKAKQILDGSQRDDGESWKKTIEKAESYSFFKGAIRFLFTNDTGNAEDWNNFDKKWRNAQYYFDEKGLVAEEYKENAQLLRYYISTFKEWGEFWEFDYDNKPSTWKQLLISKRYKANHIILMNLLEKGHDFSSFISSLDKYDVYKELQEEVQNELVRTNILVKSSEWSMKLNWRYNNYSLYPYNTKTQKKIYVIANKRNQILSQLVRRDGFNSNNRIEDCDFFWGWDIPFEYSFKNISYKFQWDIDGKICLMEDGHYKESKDKYCINSEELEDADNLIKKMNYLLNSISTN